MSPSFVFSTNSFKATYSLSDISMSVNELIEASAISLAVLDLVSKLIPNSSSLLICSSVNLFLPLPLYALIMSVFLYPIFSFGFKPIFSISSILILDFIVSVSIVSLAVIFEVSTPMFF